MAVDLERGKFTRAKCRICAEATTKSKAGYEAENEEEESSTGPSGAED